MLNRGLMGENRKSSLWKIVCLENYMYLVFGINMTEIELFIEREKHLICKRKKKKRGNKSGLVCVPLAMPSSSAATWSTTGQGSSVNQRSDSLLNSTS